MAIEYNFTLDMDRSKRDNNIAYARTGDVDSITINADLVLNGAAYTPTGTNAFFECITPNGHSVRVAASKTGSSVSVDVPSAAFQAAGVINVAYFRFETGEADNPTYVESTEPFAIVVREGIGDNIDAGDYIEEWRCLADQLEAAVAEVEQKAEQAKTDINEQKEEVDQLKAQAQVSIAQDVEDVSDAKDTAISNINGSQGAVDAAIEKLEQKTQEAVDATQEALDGTIATNLQNAIDRTLKLDIADMVNITDSTSLSSLTGVGSYCCKTAATAATISDSPVDDSPFNMYVFSSATSGQVMQLVVPIDLNSKPTAEWHVRFGTSSAMDPWSVIGGGADIAAGLGIDVTGDAKKTVSLDTDAFYQHHEAASIIQGSTEVTGGGRFKELVVYGNTRQNLWVNPNTSQNSISATSNADGSVKVSGTPTAQSNLHSATSFALKPGSTYYISCSPEPSGFSVGISQYVGNAFKSIKSMPKGGGTVTIDSDVDSVTFVLYGFKVGTSYSGTYRIMLNEGEEAEPWCPPGLNGVDELSIVTAGKNIASTEFKDTVSSGITFNTEFDGSISMVGTATSTYPQCVKVMSLPSNTDMVASKTVTGVVGSGGYCYFLIYGVRGSEQKVIVSAKNADEVAFNTGEYDYWIFTSVAEGNGVTFNCKLYPQLELGSTATAYEPPVVITTPIDLQGHVLNSLPDGTRDELRIDGTGAVTLVQRVGVATAPTDASGWKLVDGRGEFNISDTSTSSQEDMTLRNMCDALPVRKAASDPAYAFASTSYGYAKHPSITDASTAASIAGGATYLYPLATPKVIPLASIEMPELASPVYTAYASSSVPAEIEADVVKVDYLPPSDVYTKAEVDKKIEDAGGMPDVVPVSKGGTGVTTAAAERNRLGLGNTTGALPVANGGTGKTTAKAAQNALLANIDTVSTDAGDDSFFVGYYQSPSDATGSVYKRPAATVWNWIAGKIRSTFGFSSGNVLPVSHGGTGLTENPSVLVNLASDSASDVLASSPRPGVTGTLPVSHGGTGATAPGVDMLSNLGITFGTADPPSTGTPGSIYIQYFE